MPSNRSRLSRLGGKVFNVGFWGGIIALWCLRLGDHRPLIVRFALDMEEKQERIREAVERGLKKAAENEKKAAEEAAEEDKKIREAVERGKKKAAENKKKAAEKAAENKKKAAEKAAERAKK